MSQTIPYSLYSTLKKIIFGIYLEGEKQHIKHTHETAQYTDEG